MPMLVELSLMNCEGINSSSMTALSHCLMLEVSSVLQVIGVQAKA